jgi:hypothetical protein
MINVQRLIVVMAIPAICCVGVALGREVAVEPATVLSTLDRAHPRLIYRTENI